MRPPATLLDDLTEPQREAVLHGEGPLLVVAGPGSGKTRVITRRVAHLVSRGYHPSSILAITFTNKAAREMARRVEEICPVQGAWLRTFHSACAAVLRRWPESAGLAPGFSIFDDQDQRRVIKGVLDAMRNRPEGKRPAEFRSAISSWKMQCVSPQEALADSHGFERRTAAEVYAGYEKALAKSNAVDFDDLLVRTLGALRSDAELLRTLQYRFEHVLIDEYQDTSPVQFQLAALLADRTRNLCATGDPDQSIYAFRKADLRNILHFEEHFPGARVVRLEQNFRSVGNVLKAADALISCNVKRHPKRLFTEAADGPPLTLVGAGSESDEGHAVAAAVLDAYGRGVPYKDLAIFYRTNAQSRAIEAALRAEGVPYTIVKGLEFYQRVEIKDLLAYLRVLANPKDRESMARVLATPPKGIGAKTLERILAFAEERELPIRDALVAAAAGAGLPRKPSLALRAVAEMLATLEPMTRGSVQVLIDRVLAFVRYEEHLRNRHPEDAEDRIENMRELSAAAQEYDQFAQQEANLVDFLHHVGLVSDVDGYDADAPRVSMMTLHTAKGLEFDEVVITGLEDGMLPHLRSHGDADAMEEERRLLFVGLTRARKRVTLSYALDRRAQLGSLNRPSPFLDELPQDILVRGGLAQWGGNAFHDPGSGGARWRGRRYGGSDDEAQWRDEGPAAARGAWGGDADPDAHLGVDEDPSAGLRVGALVEHAKFGIGRVRQLMGRGERARAVVHFRNAGEKTLALSYVRLDVRGDP